MIQTCIRKGRGERVGREGGREGGRDEREVYW